MVTLAAAKTNPSQSWQLFIQIMGLGDWISEVDAANTPNNGAACFCYSRPSFAVPLPVWKPTLVGEIDQLSERANIFGGFPDLGSIAFDVLDHGDFLTDRCRLDAAPTTRLMADYSDSATELVLKSTYEIPAQSLIFVGREAMFVDAVTGAGLSQTVTVRRGALGTEAQSLKLGGLVYTHIPTLKGRKVVLTILPDDADDFDESRSWTYICESPSWDQDMNVWKFSAIAFMKFLERTVPRKPNRFVVVDPSSWIRSNVVGQARDYWGDDPERRLHVKSEASGEIFTLGHPSNAYDYAWPKPTLRALAGTAKADEFESGDTYTQVMFGSHDFRYSPDTAGTRDSGTWIKTSNPVEILLIILLSSADPEDGLELVNYVPGENNYSSLPAGYGVGIPASLVDFESFDRLRKRFSTYSLDNLALGRAEAKSFVKWADEEILKPFGLYLVTRNGRVGIACPRIPLISDDPPEITVDNLLISPRDSVRWGLVRSSDRTKPAVTYLIGPKSTPVTFEASDFSTLAAKAPGWYEDAETPEEIHVPGADSSDYLTFGNLAFRRILRSGKPLMIFRAEVSAEFLDTSPGDVIQVSLDVLPDLASGTRGWQKIALEVFAVEVAYPLDAPPHVSISGFAYLARDRAPEVAPSGRVLTVGMLGGAFELAFASQEYTSPDGQAPTDAQGFRVGQRIQVWSPDLMTLRTTNPVLPVINNIQSDRIEGAAPSGSFDSVVPGDIVLPAVYDASYDREVTPFGYMASGFSERLDSSGLPAEWVGLPDIWGEQ